MMAIAVAAMSFTACSNDLTEDVTPSQEFTVQINAVENLSRTHFGDLNEDKYPTLWDATDKIKVALNYATAKNSTNTEVSTDGTTAVFTADLSADTTAPYTVYAVSPAEVVNSQYINNTYNSWTLTIPANQTPAETSCDPAAQVLVGQSAASETRPTSVDIAFSHLTAYAKINFTNVALGTATVNSVTITADQNIAGQFFYYVADNTNGNTAGSIGAKAASKTITVTTETLSSVWVALAPTAVSELSFTINTDQGPIIKEVTGLNKVFKSGVVATFNVDMTGKTIATPDVYTLVTDLSVLAEGDNVIIASAEDNYAISTDNSGYNRPATAITKDGNTIIPTTTVGIFTVHDAGTNLYAFKDASNDDAYLYDSSTGTYKNLQTQATNNANGYWDITIKDTTTGAAKVVSQGTSNVMQYNYNNGKTPRFSCYAGTQTDVALYYKSNGGAKIAIDPQIIASDISNISDAGVTDATANIVVRGIASVTATPDGTVVTAASVSGNVLTYTVAANSGEAREGSITLNGGGVEVKVTVSQDAVVSGSSKLYRKVNTITSGKKYIITGGGLNKALVPSTTSKKLESADVTITENGIVSTSTIDKYAVTISASGSTYAISYTIDDTLYYLYYSGSTNLSTTTSAKNTWNITTTAQYGTFAITDTTTTDRGLLFRSSTYNQFGGYKTSNLNGTEYYYVDLYEYTE